MSAKVKDFLLKWLALEVCITVGAFAILGVEGVAELTCKMPFVEHEVCEERGW